jgi:chromosome segregation ATPase
LVLFPLQVGQKNSDCLELEASVKNLNSSKNDLIRNFKKIEEKCQDLEKQTETEFREKLKLTEELKASKQARERATSDASRLKEQIKEYRGLYEANVKDAVVRRDSLEKKSLQNQELHKKYSKQAMKLAEVCTCVFFSCPI